jgi:integrase/recombinase XerD
LAAAHLRDGDARAPAAPGSSNPNLNPLKIVQVLLGHSSIATAAIYLRCVELHGAELAESLAYLYGELVPDAA